MGVAPAAPAPGRSADDRWPPLRATWERLTTVPAALVYSAVLWAWRLPRAYDAALGGEWVHHVEHLAFFGAALLFWWPVIGPAPRARRPASHGLRIAHVVTAALHGSIRALVWRLLAALERPTGTAAAELGAK